METPEQIRKYIVKLDAYDPTITQLLESHGFPEGQDFTQIVAATAEYFGIAQTLERHDIPFKLSLLCVVYKRVEHASPEYYRLVNVKVIRSWTYNGGSTSDTHPIKDAELPKGTSFDLPSNTPDWIK